MWRPNMKELRQKHAEIESERHDKEEQRRKNINERALNFAVHCVEEKKENCIEALRKSFISFGKFKATSAVERDCQCYDPFIDTNNRSWMRSRLRALYGSDVVVATDYGIYRGRSNSVWNMYGGRKTRVTRKIY